MISSLTTTGVVEVCVYEESIPHDRVAIFRNHLQVTRSQYPRTKEPRDLVVMTTSFRVAICFLFQCLKLKCGVQDLEMNYVSLSNKMAEIPGKNVAVLLKI